MKKLLFILLILTSQTAQCKDFFFRPMEGGPYGKSDGSSYINAWHKDDTTDDKGHVNWNSMQAGDRLLVCGVHDSGYKDKILSPTQQVIIDGACLNDPGTLFHAGFKISNFGKADEFGIYQIHLGGDTNIQVIEDRKLRLRKPGYLPDEKWLPGSFYHDIHKKTLYYKPSTEPVSDHTIYTTDGLNAIRIKNISHVTVRNLTIANVTTGDGAIMLQSAPHTTIEHNKIKWSTTKAIRGSDASYSNIISNEIYDSANGIYFIDESASITHHTTISNNHIYNIDQDLYYRHDDAHGICIQGGHDNIISNNHIHDIGGTGITLFTYRDQEQYNNLIEGNTVENIHSPPGTRRVFRGIESGGFNDNAPEKIYGNIVKNNTISNIKNECLRNKSVKSPNGVGWSFYNNKTNNCGSSFAWNESADGAPAFIAENNTFINSPLHLYQKSFNRHEDHSEIIMKNNTYSPGSIYMWGGRRYKSLQYWKNASGKGSNSKTIQEINRLQ